MSNPTVVARTIETDPFCDDVLADPSAMYRELGEAGPVVRLPSHEIFASTRFEQVDSALRDAATRNRRCWPDGSLLVPTEENGDDRV